MSELTKTYKRTKRNLMKNRFLFEQLVKRDFSHKYKGTMLGMGWSILAPLLQLLVLKIVFTEFFGRNTPHFTIYLFSGVTVMNYYREATTNGMTSLVSNASILTKIKVPKYLFLLSRNVSALVNYMLILIVYLLFCVMDGIDFHANLILLVFPVLCLLVMNIGVGMVLSALYVFFRDMTYLYSIFLMILNYLSAFPMEIRPLRERREDIIPLSDHFLKRYNRKTGEHKRFSMQCYKALLRYDWPENVWEVRTVTERAAIISRGDEIEEPDLMLDFMKEEKTAKPEALHIGEKNGRFTVHEECRDLKYESSRLEAFYMSRAFEKYHNIRDAAASLGIDSSTFVRKRQRYKQMGLMEEE